jgi:hypothetical protein
MESVRNINATQQEQNGKEGNSCFHPLSHSSLSPEQDVDESVTSSVCVCVIEIDIHTHTYIYIVCVCPYPPHWTTWISGQFALLGDGVLSLSPLHPPDAHHTILTRRRDQIKRPAVKMRRRERERKRKREQEEQEEREK